MPLKNPRRRVEVDHFVFKEKTAGLYTSHMRYDQYNLKRNPFSGSVPRDKIDFIVERGNEVKDVSWTISSALEGVSTHSIIVGGYGNGKTHLLRYVKKVLGNNNGKILAIYINTPGESFKSLYCSIIYALGQAFMKKVAWSYLGHFCSREREGNPNYLKRDDREKISEVLNNDPYNIKKLVEEGKILLPQLIDEAKEFISSRVSLVDFTTAFLHLILKEYWFLAWKWLCGEEIPYTQRRELELSMSITSDERALRSFLSLKRLLHDIGYSLIVLLIDEFEVIEALSTQAKQKVLNEIRHLIDLTPSGLCILLSCAPEIWRSILSDYHAFTERFTHAIFLKPLDKADLRKLMVAYLSKERISDPSNEDPLHPFVEDTLDFLISNGMGNIRQTLKLCQLAVNLGLRHGKERLDAVGIKSLLSQLPSLNLSLNANSGEDSDES